MPVRADVVTFQADLVDLVGEVLFGDARTDDGGGDFGEEGVGEVLGVEQGGCAVGLVGGGGGHDGGVIEFEANICMLKWCLNCGLVWSSRRNPTCEKKIDGDLGWTGVLLRMEACRSPLGNGMSSSKA